MLELSILEAAVPAEIGLILEKQGCKKDALVAHGIGYAKIIFVLLTEVIALYMQALIIYIGVSGLEEAIIGCGVCFKLALLLALDK